MNTLSPVIFRTGPRLRLTIFPIIEDFHQNGRQEYPPIKPQGPDFKKLNPDGEIKGSFIYFSIRVRELTG
jgi:hypothetical protein